MTRIAEKFSPKVHVFKTLLVLLTLGLASPAWAITLDQARSQGLIGERPDGLIAAVSSNASAEVTTLISEVNSARLGSYRRLATQDSAPLQAVQAVAGEKLIDKARQNGWYTMDTSGGWRR